MMNKYGIIETYLDPKCNYLLTFLFGSKAQCSGPKVSLLGVVALWDDCKFIPEDWGGHSSKFVLCSFI